MIVCLSAQLYSLIFWQVYFYELIGLTDINIQEKGLEKKKLNQQWFNNKQSCHSLKCIPKKTAAEVYLVLVLGQFIISQFNIQNLFIPFKIYIERDCY